MKIIGLRFQALQSSRSNLFFNYLLLLTLFIHGCCPLELLLKPSHLFAVVEQMPQYKGGTKQLMMDFNREFSFQGSNDEVMPSTLVSQFVITRCGTITGLKSWERMDHRQNRVESIYLGLADVKRAKTHKGVLRSVPSGAHSTHIKYTFAT